MKINESQLRKIIKESIKKVLNEAEYNSGTSETYSTPYDDYTAMCWAARDYNGRETTRDNNMPSYLPELSERLERNLNRPYKELINKIGHNLFSVKSTYIREGVNTKCRFIVSLMYKGLDLGELTEHAKKVRSELTEHVKKIAHLMFNNLNHIGKSYRRYRWDDDDDKMTPDEFRRRCEVVKGEHNYRNREHYTINNRFDCGCDTMVIHVYINEENTRPIQVPYREEDKSLQYKLKKRKQENNTN